MDQTESIVELSNIYKMVETFVSMKEYDEPLQEELMAAFPNYMDVLQASRRDLTRSDCGIVITGETSAGKTTLINLIVNHKKLFVTSNLAATGKVCRIRNSEQIGLSLLRKDDSLIKKEEAGDIKTLKKVIHKYTDISNCPPEFKEAYFVDVCLPVPLLKGNVIIVDTPGIGETEELDQILLDFLPHAVSFIFLVNAQNAGGIHGDRLMKILRAIREKREKMPCFDPRDVLFLTNKWDCIEDDSSEEDDSDDDTDENPQKKKTKLTEKEKTWNLIKEKLGKGWSAISVEKIFRLSLKQVTKQEKTEFTEEYSRFQKVLTETIEHNQNKRLKFYFSFLMNFAQNAERGTLARIRILEGSEEEQREIISKNKKKIEEIEKECRSKKVILLEYKTVFIDRLTDRLYVFTRSDDGKWKMLGDIMSMSLSDLQKVIPERIQAGIQNWCKGEEYSRIMEEVDKKIESCVRDIHVQLDELETEMTGTHIAFADDSLGVRAIGYGMAFLLFGPLTLVFAIVIEFFLAPLTFFFGWFESRESKMRRKIDEIYLHCLAQLSRRELGQMFDKSVGVEYTKSILLIFEEKIPKQLHNLNKINDKLLKEMLEIRKKQHSLEKLHKVIKDISKATEYFRQKHSSEIK